MAGRLYRFEHGSRGYFHQEVVEDVPTGRWVQTWDEPDPDVRDLIIVNASPILTAGEVEDMKGYDDARYGEIMGRGILSDTHRLTVEPDVSPEGLKAAHHAAAILALELGNIGNA